MKLFKACTWKNKGRNELVLNNVMIAGNFFDKLFGLIFKKRLKNGEGLLIENCRSIHTFGMRYRIDAVYLNGDNMVLAIFQDIKPFRVTPLIKNASKVLEVRSKTIKHASLKVNDLVLFVN